MTRTAVGAAEPEHHEPTSTYTTTSAAVTVTWPAQTTTNAVDVRWRELDAKSVVAPR